MTINQFQDNFIKDELYELFKSKNWYLQKNEKSIYYSKIGGETNYFEIKILKNTIMVSVPIKNSVYQYSTTFHNNNYSKAIEYIKQKFLDFDG